MNLRNICMIALAVGACTAECTAAAEAEPASNIAGVVLNVTNLERSVSYYTALGLKSMRTRGTKPNRVVLFNVVLAEAKFQGGLALAESHDPAGVNLGNGFARMFLTVHNVRALCRQLAEMKLPCTREPKIVPEDGNSIIAIAKDPDGYTMELIEPPAGSGTQPKDRPAGS
ncbi:MAG: VOC family protein [Proteobacteria bacterium]|nr:VOC family protein [Pseudomonadota bacterium]